MIHVCINLLQDFKDIFLTSVQMTATWRASVSYTIDAGDKEYASDDVSLSKLINIPQNIYEKMVTSLH